MSGDPYWSSVALLLPFDGPNGSTIITDLSPVANVMTPVGVAAITTTNPKFGTGSFVDMAVLADSGSLNNLHTPCISGSPLDLSTSDFTIECWVLPLALDGFNRPIISAGDNTATAGYGIIQSFNIPTFTFGTHSVTYPTALPFGVWSAVAAVRRGNVFDLFVNGVSSTIPVTQAGSIGLGPSGLLYVGASPNFATHTYNGQIDEVRISRVARYAANYTPAGPFGIGFPGNGDITNPRSWQSVGGALPPTEFFGPAGGSNF